MKAAPTERVAGVAFFFFTLLQIPFFIVDTNLSPHGVVVLSPLQVTVANLAKTFPDQAPYLEYVLVPGGWLRDAFAPVARCQFKTGGKGPCDAEKAKLFDLQHVVKENNLPMLVKLLETEGMAQQMPILYGCTLIVVSAIFSLYYSVKTAVVGFILLAFGVAQGNHVPLPPGVLTAFLCVYAGFNLGELRGNRRRQQQKQRQAVATAGSSRHADSVAGKQTGRSSSSTPRGRSAARTPSKKQHKKV